MIVYLVSSGDGHYDLEPAPVDPAAREAPQTFWGRRLDHLRRSWRRKVEEARRRQPSGFLARWRTRMVCELDESIEEQRSLWALRDRRTATLVHPPELNAATASQVLRDLLGDARRYHGRWLAVDTVLFAGSGVLMVLPGPNLIAYYFAFRVVEHYLSWRGARQALDVVSWTFEPRS